MEAAGLPITDLGIQRGYGLFDFLRVRHGVPLFLERHLDRFFASAEAMHMVPSESRERIAGIVRELIDANSHLSSSGIRLFLTGGPSPDGYLLGDDPTLFLVQQPLPTIPDEPKMPGLRLFSYPYSRQLPHVKTLDYVMAVWLQPWLRERGGDDLLYHRDGVISESPKSNFFLVTAQGTLATPSSDMLAGVTRHHILLAAERAGIEVEQRDVTLSEIADAREAIITSSTRRLSVIREIDGFELPEHHEHPVSRRIWDAFVEIEDEYIRARRAND